MGVSAQENIEKALALLKETLQALEEMEYAVELLESELKEYRELVCKESYILGEKFVRRRIHRFVERAHRDGKLVYGVGVKVLVPDNLGESERLSIVNYTAMLLGDNVRPWDVLFKLEGDSFGVVFAVEKEEDFKSILNRLQKILFNFRAQTIANVPIPVNCRINAFPIEPGTEVEELFAKLRKLLE